MEQACHVVTLWRGLHTRRSTLLLTRILNNAPERSQQICDWEECAINLAPNKSRSATIMR